MGRLVGIEHRNGADALLQACGEAHHELLHILRNLPFRQCQVVPSGVAGAVVVAHGGRLAARQVLAVERGAHKPFVAARLRRSVPSHAHPGDGPSDVGLDHVARQQDGTAHLGVEVQREAVVLPNLVVVFGIAHVGFPRGDLSLALAAGQTRQH